MVAHALAERATVALDALIEGRHDEARRIGYTLTTIKQAVRALCAEGRIAESVFLLTSRMPLERALREIAPTPTASVGDILVSSWGYDQTNVDFYQVIAVSGVSVTIRAIGKNYHPSMSSHGTDAVSPAIGAFVDGVMRKRVQPAYGGGYRVKIASYSSARIWDGKPCHQTAAGYGH